MKSIGVVRPVDNLGRIVLPIELRRTLGIQIKDPLEIFVEGDSIILKPYKPCCVFCGEGNGVVHFHGKNICKDCLDALKEK